MRAVWFDDYFEGVWASVLPAADFESFDVRPSRIVFDAAVAASALVSRSGLPDWDRALAADILDASLVLLL